MLVQQFLETSAERWPDKVALVAGDKRATYADLERVTNRLAHALAERGVRRGDRVLVLLDSGIEAVVAMFAVLKAGAAYVMLHPGTRRERLAYTLETAEPAGLITDSLRVRTTLDLIGAARSLRTVVWVDRVPPAFENVAQHLTWADLNDYPSPRPSSAVIDLDLAMLIYTSGSTGEPKGVMASHANLLAATRSINAYLLNQHDEVILNVLPLAHGYGLSQIFLSFDVGARVVLESAFAFPTRIVKLLEAEGITALPGVPAFFALLLRQPELFRRDFPALRYLTNAAAALPTSHIHQLRTVFPNARIISMYGQTEALPRIAYLPADELEKRPDSVGKAIPNTEVYTIGENGQRLRAGEIGELVVRGSNVARGYWCAPELTAQRFRPGPLPGETVLHTGDLFRIDADGYLYFVSRKDDMINTRGEKVSPKEVENAVCQMPGVAEAAVLGVPDAVFGQAVLLVVAPLPGVQLEERAVRAFCMRTLDDYMQPKYVDIVSELPHNENGKVDKRGIRAEFVSAEGAG
jgi:amino acid adenylation domain-containing protein